MRGIAKLLFGDEAGGLPGLFGDGDADGFGLAEQARRSGEWCASTPAMPWPPAPPSARTTPRLPA